MSLHFAKRNQKLILLSFKFDNFVKPYQLVDYLENYLSGNGTISAPNWCYNNCIKKPKFETILKKT